VRLDAPSGSCDILFGDAGGLHRLARGRRMVAVVDRAAKKFHPRKMPECPSIVVQGGEAAKTLGQARKMYDRFAELGVDRSWLAVGIGGGAVCDLAGFVAATYHRGVPLALVPTTLLAQVDGAIGGKSAVNLGERKNAVGAIRQPMFVLCDPGFLPSLPKGEVRNGLAEIVKCAVVADAGLFKFLEGHGREALVLDLPALRRAVGAAVAVKARIVAGDEADSGERLKLNFGHTVGHALEGALGLSHGEAVALGILAETSLSVEMGFLEREDGARVERLVRSLVLPKSRRVPMPRKAVELMKADKKARGDALLLPVLDGIGKCRIVGIDWCALEDALENLRQRR
jgi:3-dehydroquinate synthase